MVTKNRWAWTICSAAALALALLQADSGQAEVPAGGPPMAAQSVAAFLISPYYGSELRTSHFDHESPDYIQNGIFSRYDGARWVPPALVGPQNCNDGQTGPYEKCYDGHAGTDFSLAYERVLAAANGTVAAASWFRDGCYSHTWNCAFGLRVEIEHSNGYRTIYAHLSAIAVEVGQKVLAGQVIGTSGNTGNSVGAHLHFEVWNTVGDSVDAFGYLGSDCLWSGGQWAGVCGGTSAPIQPPAEVSTHTVDDLDPPPYFERIMLSNPHWYQAASGYNNHLWWTYPMANVGTADVVWRANLPAEDFYEVFVWIPLGSYATTHKGRYLIAHVGGHTRATVDQDGVGDRWLSLGVYRLRQGTHSYVNGMNGGPTFIQDDGTGPCPEPPLGSPPNDHCVDGYHRYGYDAVRFVRLSGSVVCSSHPPGLAATMSGGSSCGTYTYLPDLRNKDGWVSRVYVRNDGEHARTVSVEFHDAGGNPTTTSECALRPNEWCVLPVDQGGRIPSGAVGSAIVSCAGDASAVAVHVHAQGAGAYTGLRSPGWGDANWESTGTHQRLAGILRGAGGITSKIKVVNTGHTAASLDLTYYGLNGAAYTLPSADIASFSALSIEPPAGVIPEGFQGALDAYAEKQALAVFVDNVDAAGRVVGSASGSRGATTLHLPALAKYVNEYGYTYNTCVNFANLENVANVVQAVYYWHNVDGGSGWRESFSIPANGQVTRCQQNQPLPHTWLSARVTAQYPIAATVHSVNEIAGWSASYSGASAATTSVILPFVTRQGVLGGRQWDTVITLQNAGARTTTPHLVFYASDGSIGLVNPFGEHIPPGRSVTVKLAGLNLPSGFQGSAVVNADQPIVAIVSAVCVSGCSGDRVFSYNGVNH